MRYIRYAFLAALAVVLVTVAIANRDMVTLNLLPADLAVLSGVSMSISLPLFVVIFGAIVAGLLIGFVWEWMREYKHRSAASTHKREKEQLAREVSKLKTDKAKKEGDEVLALLER
ncbi:MAG: LapA family protein [Rhodobacteraceae bacterium]|uniref:LapA family protein n=1 Tax=Celeribacter sp. HF31 TaxID=2721558 RepID=UPI001430A0ED|nr:LapA family protein [Celeribacter sp. HF31]NIY80027.1 LapA family protein [Celeribacter sp. HF31]NVK47438.1 LapA family protein [Paracoccaceae bacterium]